MKEPFFSCELDALRRFVRCAKGGNIELRLELSSGQYTAYSFSALNEREAFFSSAGGALCQKLWKT
jgi:hypothetical protein